MDTSLIDSIINFFVYFLASLGGLGGFVFAYYKTTPYHDFKLISEGNKSASVILSGAVIGFSLSLSRTVEQSHNPIDFVTWLLVSIVAQLLTYRLVHYFFPDLGENIKKDSLAPALFLAALSVSIGLLISASMTE